MPASQETGTTQASLSGGALLGDLLLFLDPPVFPVSLLVLPY